MKMEKHAESTRGLIRFFAAASTCCQVVECFRTFRIVLEALLEKYPPPCSSNRVSKKTKPRKIIPGQNHRIRLLRQKEGLWPIALRHSAGCFGNPPETAPVNTVPW